MGVGAIAGIVVGCLLAILAIAFSVDFFVFRKMRIASQNKRMVERFRSLSSVLMNDCQNRVSRIKYLSDNGAPGFRKIYESLAEEYTALSGTERESASQALSAVSAMVKAKETKGLNRAVSEASKAMGAYAGAVERFKARIDQALAEDDSFHAMILESKARLRDFRSLCSEHEVELRPIADVLEKVFKGFEEFFVQYDCYLDKADYVSAKALLDRINKVLAALHKYGSDLYISIPLAKEVLPARIKAVRREAEQATEEGLPIPQLRVVKSLDEMTDSLEEIDERFRSLRLAGIKERLDSMGARIEELEKAIVKERESKSAFEKIHTDSNEALLATEERYSKAKDSLKQMEEYYKIGEGIEESLEVLGEKIETLGRLLREIDNAVSNNVSPTPYSELLSMQREAKSLEDEIQVDFHAFHSSMKGLADESEEIHEDIRKSLFKIASAKADLIDVDVKAFAEARLPQYEALLEKMERIDDLLSKRPIDMEEVESLYRSFVGERDVFIGDVTRDCVMAKKAELLIVYANQYRPNFSRIEKEASRAEESFYAGDFATSFDIVNSVLLAERVGEESTAY